ncbi:alanine--tRNA ligase [Dellaglioa algida]|uniref:Alanine--tRNA ligase n=1 Tax=Dellaglioa algida TaxID=105612 RepID=A0A5C6MAD2_9LACO|nr:alanine--tRNA ligase [Dellaglioa algida]MDK1717283.1 alanine--tRNA ligase [Dellaglioa algida]MDK1720468.1 alanine--tRNA ligase [Dellaglioa algida]MDK1722225.1 alanine--tRNA ligase [Dellaglioa algida]MDK1723850.1 alanine--tRNA ligase [Dellaglioa algida]MDK1725430.1 alanine--tRNA ligase [Dellaglioa algida]
MKKMTSTEIRQMYLDFFKEKGHTIEPSASLLPVDDPTLLWINSGVATLKKYFDGSVVPENPRITNAQKSIRTNDIENVGKTARHHTLFEMLGNFSIGDYFKPEAINWAWELLTSEKWFAFDPEKLYVTVYPKDLEAKRIWLEEVKLPKNHLVEVEDNFWDIGQGPSGPDTEIFYDRGQSFNNLAEDDPENYPGGENERYLEVWNIVFSEFNHTPENTYEPLPHQNIDTGMGLERVVSIFQNAKTNFETDLFLPLIDATEKMSDNKKYDDNEQDDISFKVIADHARAISFAIGDGALPSNEGRGYVIRRLIRRAVMHGQKLGIEGSFLTQLVPVVGNIMKDYYPEVLEQAEYISKIVRSEEERFNETLKDGLQLLNNLIETTKAENKSELSGAGVFKLYDTYGFPFELTKEYAEDEGLSVDQEGFNAEMQQQKERARAARGNAKSMGVQNGLLTDIKTVSEYVGYTHPDVNETEIVDLIVDNELVDTIKPGDNAQVIFSKTPFYAEMGGQVADKGTVKDTSGNVIAEVEDVQHAPNGQNLHAIKVLAPMEKNQLVSLEINQDFHKKVEKNHTATHLLDQALRDVLGEHTHQAGSLVEPTYLRFDFTNIGSVSEKQLEKVEKIVNDKIWAELAVETVETDIESAKNMGAIALFSEKYGKIVRVVKIGDYSIEFCGGTHVANTSEIGLFKIISESGVGAGVRRIEAVTSKEAFDFLNGRSTLLESVAQQVKANKVVEVPKKIEQLQASLKTSEQQIQAFEDKIASQQAGDVFKNKQEINGKTLIAAQVSVSGMSQLRQLADQWKTQGLSDVLAIGTTSDDGKVNLITAVSADGIKSGLKAGDLIKTIAPFVGGGGGGRPDLAQAGGKNPAGLGDAIKEATNWLENQTK